MNLRTLSIFIHLDIHFYKNQLKILTDNISKRFLNNITFHFYMPNKLNLFYPKNSELIIQKDLSYFLKIRDHRMYSGFLDYINKKKIDLSIIYRLEYPEFLLSDLNFFKKINSKIFIISWAYELNNKSEARSNLFVDLIKNQNITKCIIPSILGKDSTGPKYFEKKFNLIKKKIIKISEIRFYKPINYNKNFCRKKINLQTKKFVLLFFGQPFFGKGFDIFIKLIKSYKKKNILFYIQTPLKNINFDIKKLNQINKYKNLVFKNKSVNSNLVKYIYGAADAVCIPYKKTYTYGTSSVFFESILFSRPVIVPNFNPFRNILKKFKLGVLFESEDLKSLKKNLDKLVDGFDYNSFKEDRELYINYTDDYKLFIDTIEDEFKSLE